MAVLPPVFPCISLDRHTRTRSGSLGDSRMVRWFSPLYTRSIEVPNAPFELEPGHALQYPGTIGANAGVVGFPFCWSEEMK